MTNGEMERLARRRDRFLRLANADQEFARQLFNAGQVEFADPLKDAHQKYGAAVEIDRELNGYGYQKKPKLLEKYTDREISLIIQGLKQKLFGLGIVFLGILSILPEKDATGALLIVPFGIYVMKTKDRLF